MNLVSGSLYYVKVRASHVPVSFGSGTYRIYLEAPYAHLRSIERNFGAFERITFLESLERRGVVSFTPITTKQEQLETEICAFAAWRFACA